MSRPTLTLRNTLALITAAITALALGVSAAVVVLTTHLQRTSEELASSVESVRLAEEAQIDILLHARTDDDLVRRRLERDIQQRLAEARPHVHGPEEERVLHAAEAKAGDYIAASRKGRASPELERSAYLALQLLTETNGAQSRLARRKAEWWGELADAIGFGAAGLVIVIATLLLWWLRRRAFQPVLALAEAMERYGRGDREVRAELSGPAELYDMAERFNQMATALGARPQAQMAFLAGVAHDLRNPLGALATAVELIPPDGPPGPSALTRTMGIVKRQLARLNRMVDDLLDTTKIEAGQLELKLDEHDLRALVDEVVQLFVPIATEHDIEVSLCAEPLPVRCDAMRVEQVVSNLLSNALKYSPDAPRIEIEVYRDGDDGVVCVNDHGIGISEADQRLLFEPFRRAGLSKETIPGVGLGLFVVRRIVEAHDGRIELHSALGRGARFIVRLPLHLGAEPHAKPWQHMH
jgi:signal transduction histidine kinase